MVQQIEKDVSHSQSGREYLTAWAQRSSQSFTQMSVYSDDGLSQSFVWGSASESLLRRLGALDPEYLPRCTKMRKADALSHPPPNIYDYAEDARGPGSAPAVWFQSWYGCEFEDSEQSRVLYDRARRNWRQMVPKEQLVDALRARPMPTQSGSLPRITIYNAQDYPPPSTQHYLAEEMGPGSAPYVWFTQMMGWDWQLAWNDATPDAAETLEYAISKGAYYSARRRWLRLLPDFRIREQAREQTRVREKGSKNPAPQDRKRERNVVTDQPLLALSHGWMCMSRANRG